MSYFLVIIFIYLFCFSFSRDLGVYGHTFSIKEEDLLEYIQKKAKDSSIVSQIEQYKERILQPASVKGIEQAKEHRVFTYNPLLRISRDIKDHRDRIIVKKGTEINPLREMKLKENLIFFDGTKKEHIDWAQTLGKEFKWVLVNGKPIDLEEKFLRPVYFDQFGFLTHKLGIRAVPAKVTQSKEVLKIEEIPLEKVFDEN